MMCITLAAAAFMAETSLAKNTELAQTSGIDQLSIGSDAAIQSYLAQTTVDVD